MTRSRHADNRSILAGRAAAYVPGPRGVENAPLQDLSALVGAGSVWSTARDLHRFVEAIVSGRLGQGPRLSFVRQGRLDFNGRTGGFKAWALYDSVTRTEAIFAGNVATGAPDWLKRDILRLAAAKRRSHRSCQISTRLRHRARRGGLRRALRAAGLDAGGRDLPGAKGGRRRPLGDERPPCPTTPVSS